MTPVRPWRAYLPDVVPAAVAAVLILGGAPLAPAGRIPLDPLGYLLPLAGALALVSRRRAPIVVLAVTAVCELVYQARGYPGVLSAVPILAALYTAVEAGRKPVALPIAATALFGGLAIDLARAGGRPAPQILQDRFLLAGWIAASAVLAEVSRHRGAYLREAERRAAEAERTREETALRRAGEERLRIARELHDSLTHSISIIKVQAGVGVHLARKRGEEVPATLLAIQEASGEAMRELRATLEVLRDGEPPGSGLDRLEQLVERARAAGLPTTLTVEGPERALPAEVDRAAYRIVQEALTNITRHAGPATASVRVGYGADALTVQVDDDGRATPDADPEPGVGLRGMRERVAALGGRLHARPRAEGGFTVRAELPAGDAA